MHPIRIEPVLDSEPTTLRGRISEFPEVVQFAQDFVGRVPYDALRALGVYKSLDTPFWPAHTIVTFPFYRDLESRSDVEGCLSQMRTAQVEAAHIYVHVPFCTAVCDYCAYSRIGSVGEDRVGAYIVALRSEVKWWKAHFGGRLPSASSIYFGGGTPTSISLDALGELLGAPDREKAGRALHAMFQMKKIDIAALRAAFDGQ